MYTFWVRLTIFSMFWVLLIIFQSDHKPWSMISFAVAAGFYFFSSLQKGRLLLYLMMSIVIVLHGVLLANAPLVTVLLLLYMTAEAAFRLRRNKLLVYGLVNSGLSIWLMYVISDKILGILLISLFLYLLVAVINQLVEEQKEQREIYVQLLEEYRQLKRMNLAAEKDARLEERTKIARDIHDSVGHRLTALMMKLEMLSIEHGENGYEELKEMASDSLEETREAVKALQLEETEGLATVIHLIRRLEAESHMSVQFTMKQGVLSLATSNQHSVTLYRVIQEALTNAMRHAQSREVFIMLGQSATGDIEFEIMNVIFKPVPFQYGFGLTNMKNRLQETGGTLHVYQTEEHFIVRGTLPIE